MFHKHMSSCSFVYMDIMKILCFPIFLFKSVFCKGIQAAKYRYKTEPFEFMRMSGTCMVHLTQLTTALASLYSC